jgi:hypothetical protein
MPQGGSVRYRDTIRDRVESQRGGSCRGCGGRCEDCDSSAMPWSAPSV